MEFLKERKDLYAILDVPDPEPPIKNSPLYSMPNVVITPHISGSMSGECGRLGEYALSGLLGI